LRRRSLRLPLLLRLQLVSQRGLLDHLPMSVLGLRGRVYLASTELASLGSPLLLLLRLQLLLDHLPMSVLGLRGRVYLASTWGLRDGRLPTRAALPAEVVVLAGKTGAASTPCRPEPAWLPLAFSRRALRPRTAWGGRHTGRSRRSLAPLCS
jgi:hypothetical protein